MFGALTRLLGGPSHPTRALEFDWIAIPAKGLFWIVLLMMSAELFRNTAIPFLAASWIVLPSITADPPSATLTACGDPPVMTNPRIVIPLPVTVTAFALESPLMVAVP
jgi:hypothetical protein